jgi:hypothetical protein
MALVFRNNRGNRRSGCCREGVFVVVDRERKDAREGIEIDLDFGSAVLRVAMNTTSSRVTMEQRNLILPRSRRQRR